MKYSSHPCNRRKRNFFLFIHIAAFCIYMTLILVLAILRVTLEEKYIVINYGLVGSEMCIRDSSIKKYPLLPYLTNTGNGGMSMA